MKNNQGGARGASMTKDNFIGPFGTSGKNVMTTTIELLRKEARDKFVKKYFVYELGTGVSGTDDHVGAQHKLAADLDMLITHVHNSAIRSALEILPKAGEDPGDFGGIDDKSVRDVWWGRYGMQTETEKKLQSLLVNE